MCVFPKIVFKLFVLTSLLIGLPLFGALLIGSPIAQYLEFPPLTRYIEHQPFSILVFACFAVIAVVLFVGLTYLLSLSKNTSKITRYATKFPWWGWSACSALVAIWFLAWTRYTWFEPLQVYTFTPLWVSFIVFVNALSYANMGQCLLTHRTRLLLWLFPASSLFWWYFEYLNRYVQNWYYVGIETFSPTIYVIHASFAFSTVLPAIASGTECLASLKCFGKEPYEPVVKVSQSKWTAIIILAVGTLGLIGIAILPDYLFALIWITPLMLFVALQILTNEPNIFSGILRDKNWRILALPAFAALACGFFWELWNYFSYAKWQYSIPFVQSFKLFEMPILGYAGYPVFGLECIVVSEWLRRLLYPSN